MEAIFERARMAQGLAVDWTLAEPFSDGLNRASLVEEVAERLAGKLHRSPVGAKSHVSQKTLKKIFDLYCADPGRSWCKRTEGSYATTRKWALDVFGPETPVSAITREQCREFLNLLLIMPAHAHQQYPGKSIRAAVEAAKGKNVRIITAANVNAHLIRFCATMNWALNEGYIDRNPARGLRIPDPVSRADKRHPFSPEQLRAIFGAPIYTGCKDDCHGYSKTGDNRPRRARFWIPLIALFSGMRLNEICQLDTADVVTVDGVICFRVTAASRFQSIKRVKTASSERLVPIHPELLTIGLSSYLSERQRLGDLSVVR